MSEIRNFFRYCPNCGRRFHIHLVSKEVSKVGERQEEREGVMLPVENQASGFPAPAPLLLEEGVTTKVEVDAHRYHYKCKHCGHEWTETHVEEKAKA